MKITDIRTLSLSRAHEPERQWYSATFHVPKADCSICVIETDEGLQGIAEPCAYGVPPDIAARIEQLKPSLIGRDPHDKDLVPANEAVRANDIANAVVYLASDESRFMTGAELKLDGGISAM